MSSITILGEIGNKIRGVFLGLFGSITATLSVALAVSALTPDNGTILTAGLMVGFASSFANSFGPVVSKYNLSSSSDFSMHDVIQGAASLLLTFLMTSLSLIPYLLIPTLSIARIISMTTGLVLLFIFGLQQAQMENENPFWNGLWMVLLGGGFSMFCFWSAAYFK